MSMLCSAEEAKIYYYNSDIVDPASELQYTIQDSIQVPVSFDTGFRDNVHEARHILPWFFLQSINLIRFQCPSSREMVHLHMHA